MNSKSDLPPVLVSSVPKAGTHLLGRCLELLGLEDLEIGINEPGYADHKEKGTLDQWDVLEGQSTFLNPKKFRKPCLEVIPTIKEGQFALGHLPYREAISECISTNGIKHLFIYRDPRDVAVSWYRFNTYSPEKGGTMLYYYVYNALKDDSERLMKSITGISADSFLPDLYNRHYRGRIEWLEDKNTLNIRFEDLVGTSGGGDGQVQLETIERIRDWIGSSVDVEKVSDELFGKSKTFTKGRSAAWVKEFTDEHKDALKKVTGTLLQDLGYETSSDW